MVKNGYFAAKTYHLAASRTKWLEWKWNLCRHVRAELPEIEKFWNRVAERSPSNNCFDGTIILDYMDGYCEREGERDSEYMMIEDTFGPKLNDIDWKLPINVYKFIRISCSRSYIYTWSNQTISVVLLHISNEVDFFLLSSLRIYACVFALVNAPRMLKRSTKCDKDLNT